MRRFTKSLRMWLPLVVQGLIVLALAWAAIARWK